MFSGHDASAGNSHVSWRSDTRRASTHADIHSITGTPSGIGWGRKPRITLKDGDEFAVEILPHIGSLYNVMKEEK